MRSLGIAALVGTAIVCRLLYVVPLRVDQATSSDVLQRAEMERAALSLVRDGVIGNVYREPTGPTAHVAPLYPIVLGAIYWTLGAQTLPALLVQSLLAISAVAATLACLPWLARRCGVHERAAWCVAFALAILPVNYYYESFGDWEQPFSALVLVGLLGCFLRLRQEEWRNRRSVIVTGVLAGVVALLSPSVLPAVGLMWCVEAFTRRPSRAAALRGGAVIFGLAALMVLPWAVRNYFALGALVPLRSNFGLELSIGNNPHATGSSRIDWSPGETRAAFLHPYSDRAEFERLKAIGELAYMDERKSMALSWIRAHPLEFLMLSLKRFQLFWFPGLEMFDRASRLAVFKVAAFASLSVLMLIGWGRMAARRNPSVDLIAAAIVGASVLYMVTHVEMRYRLPVQALVGLLAAEGAAGIMWRMMGFLGRLDRK